jgi:hypothetical protein
MSTTNLKLVEPEADDAELRATLRQHIEQAAAAHAKRDAAQAAVDAAVDALDEASTAHNARLIAEMLEAGGGMPTLTTPELPQRALRRAEATARANALQQATERLEANLAEAEATLSANPLCAVSDSSVAANLNGKTVCNDPIAPAR